MRRRTALIEGGKEGRQKEGEREEEDERTEGREEGYLDRGVMQT